MKKILLLFLAIGFIGVFVFFLNNKNQVQKKDVLEAESSAIGSIDNPTPSPIYIKQSVLLNFKDVPLRISWVSVDPKQVDLYSNLKDKKLSEEIKVDKNCSSLVNAGFYSKTDFHLGLFISNFETLSQFSESALRNGFLSISSNQAFVSDIVPDNNLRIAVQSGPLLLLNNEILSLKIKNDEPDRRIIGAITDDNKLVFLAIYRNNSEYQGPLLADLPEIIDAFRKESGINIVSAINLDGGSASAFISDYVVLRELKYIGGYFCTK